MWEFYNVLLQFLLYNIQSISFTNINVKIFKIIFLQFNKIYEHRCENMEIDYKILRWIYFVYVVHVYVVYVYHE